MALGLAQLHMMDYNVILASNSPRRKQLLQELGIQYTVFTKPVNEDYPADIPAETIAEYLACKKGNAYLSDINASDIVVTADTTVVIDHLILNKPEDFADAQRMLRLLSGREHRVITGVCLTTLDFQQSFSDTTKVIFKKLDDQEIDHYIQHYQPYDKAGSYAIQEWIGMIGIEKIEGSYFNVVGLPVKLLYEHLLLLTEKMAKK